MKARSRKSITHSWDPQLSDREIHFIGTIFVQWGALEHEIFLQTLHSFSEDIDDAKPLPKEMNNIQFTGVLQLWKERVADNHAGNRKKTLQSQYNKILKIKEIRDALTHGMWQWSPEDFARISTIRVKKRAVITSHFTADFLQKLSETLGEINFKIRFPGGLRDLAKTYEQGGYMSRRAAAIFAGAPTDNYGYPIGNPKKTPRSRGKSHG